MKYTLLVCFSFLSLFLFAQADSVRKVEPDMRTSFEKYDLLIIAVIGLLLLMGIRFWFKRTRKR